jgi:hypothetical protein
MTDKYTTLSKKNSSCYQDCVSWLPEPSNFFYNFMEMNNNSASTILDLMLSHKHGFTQ